MSLTFTALKIKKGDAFLLEDGEYNYLFDSGGNQKKITKLLKTEKGIDTMDVAICSHNDSDHSRGFIGLLKDTKFTIKEIWLPSLWASIIHFINANKNSAEVWTDIESYLLSFNVDENDDIWEDYHLDSLYGEESVKCDDFKEQLASINNVHESYHNYSGDSCAFLAFLKTNVANHIVKKLKNIIEIASLAYQRNCKIVWFKNIPCACKPYAYGFVPLNSEPIFVIKQIGNKPTYCFIHAVVLSAVNYFSLVFEFQKDDVPVVRFSADSDCAFQTVKPYRNNIIITAPHHGSDTNASVYGWIKGCDIIWVRSYNRDVTFPYIAFCANCKKRFCVKCPKHKFFREVGFVMGKGKWNKKRGTRCKC